MLYLVLANDDHALEMRHVTASGVCVTRTLSATRLSPPMSGHRQTLKSLDSEFSLGDEESHDVQAE
jgi:hypothetical protein